MNTISFNTANFVAREIGYSMPGGWGQGDQAANDWFSPIDTFEERFDAMLAEVAALGFDAIDLWSAHLNFTWATPEHVAIAQSQMADRNLRTVSYAGGFGNTPQAFRSACRLCALMDIPVLGGGTEVLQSNKAALVGTLREFGLVFGYENHPEKSAGEILAIIGDSDTDVIGVTVDTGWFGSQQFDGPEALRILAPRLKHVHLKDVRARRSTPTGFALIDLGHETCKYGEGIVDIKGCVKALLDIGYRGAISIEHEPEEFDPRADIAASKLLLETWLREASE